MHFIIGTAVKLASGSIRSGALLLAFASALAAGAATTYTSDPFTDGSWTNTIGGDGLGAVWYAGSAGTLSITNDAAGIGSGNALRLAGSATGQKCLAQFHPTTLTDPGDWVRLSFDFRFETAPPVSVWAGLRVGLYNTYLTRTTADGASANRNNDKGYGGFISSPGAAGANAGVFSEAPGDDILGGSCGAGSDWLRRRFTQLRDDETYAHDSAEPPGERRPGDQRAGGCAGGCHGNCRGGIVADLQLRLSGRRGGQHGGAADH